MAHLIVPQYLYDLLRFDASEKDRLAANYVSQFSQTKDGIKTVTSDHTPNSCIHKEVDRHGPLRNALTEYSRSRCEHLDFLNLVFN